MSRFGNQEIAWPCHGKHTQSDTRNGAVAESDLRTRIEGNFENVTEIEIRSAVN